MNRRKPLTTTSVALQSIGGGLFFASLGGLIGLVLAQAPSHSSSGSSPSGDLGYGLAAALIVLAGAAVGGSFGLILVARLTIGGKLLGMTMSLAFLGYAAAFLILIKLLYGM